MTKKSTKQAVDTLYNGNRSDFKKWLTSKNTSKLDILNAIEYHQNYAGRHVIITQMQLILESESDADYDRIRIKRRQENVQPAD